MNLEKLIELHNAAIGAMNDAQEAVRYLESALIKAREAHASAAKNESAISAMVTAVDAANRNL